ncbi:hypothetical protein [Bdellovibrio bacteriovorus]|uniref:hypothetical protein n=1 Tax=Bdellovibrio bacteriovorus TaxID=959 RepID=UPI003D06986B
MALSVLSQASALNPGSDLWIVPDLEKSPWTAKLDWYLNFQVCKSSRHQSPTLPDFLGSVLEQTELNKPAVPAVSDKPLMIASDKLLPNKWVVILPWNDDLTPWTAEIFRIWKNLNEPTLRIFMPPGQSTGNLQIAWQTHHPVQEFTVVLD